MCSKYHNLGQDGHLGDPDAVRSLLAIVQGLRPSASAPVPALRPEWNAAHPRVVRMEGELELTINRTPEPIRILHDEGIIA